MAFNNIRSIHNEFANAVGLNEVDRSVDRDIIYEPGTFSTRFKNAINVFLCYAAEDAYFLKNHELKCIEDISKLAVIIIRDNNPKAVNDEGRKFSRLMRKFLNTVKKYSKEEDYWRVVSDDEDEGESLYGDLGYALGVLEEWIKSSSF